MTHSQQEIPRILDPNDPDDPFPDPALLPFDHGGPLALGGDLSPERLLNAYRKGLFPWYTKYDPILWWSPDPRSVIVPGRLRITRSLQKSIRNRGYEIRLDSAFEQVIRACSRNNSDPEGSWLNADMIEAYCKLHDAGYAHSIECWLDSRLAGGLYGVAIGRVFFGESMFSVARDASKCALVHLAAHLQQWGFPLIDAQIHSSHLASLGAFQLSRATFIRTLSDHVDLPAPTGKWNTDSSLVEKTRFSGGASLFEDDRRE